MRLDCNHFPTQFKHPNGFFQAFALRENNETHESYLQTIQENKVNYKILSCDLTADGHILAMGLDSGDVVVSYLLHERNTES